MHTSPYKNEKVAARLQLSCCYYAAIKYVCNNWWRQSSQLERLVACLQQPCSFYQQLQAHRATTRSQLQLAAVTSKKTARTILYNIRNKYQIYASGYSQSVAANKTQLFAANKPQLFAANKLQLFAANKLQLTARNLICIRKTHKRQPCSN